jgi:Ca2+/Na+ antiporter
MSVVRKIITVVAMLLLVGLLIYGIKLGDFQETRYTGSILCISCIGIE